MEHTAAVALLTAVATAICWYYTYRSGRDLALRKDRLDYVNKQLSDLYGPLYVSCKAGDAAHSTLLAKLKREIGLFEGDVPPTEEEIREWHHWMKYVLSPINDRRETLILNNCHLIVEEKIPECFINFSSHAASYRAVIAKWENGDFGERYSTVKFPKELDDHVEKTFLSLKIEQKNLLERINRNTTFDARLLREKISPRKDTSL